MIKLNFMKKIMLFVFFVYSLVNYAQTPCDNGMAGPYPCNGYDLQSFIPFSTFNTSGGNDSWGWTDPDDGNEYAIMGLKNGTAFIDISDPINPVYLGKLPTHTSNSTWRDIKVYQNHAFVVSEAGGHGMQVFDLTRLRNVANPPETFTEDAHYDGFGSAHNIVINEESGYAYGVGADYNGGAHFINIQDPLNPFGEGGYAGSGYSHDAQVVTYNGPDSDYTGREIYIGSNESFVTIVDVTDKSNPVLIANATYSNDSYTHQGWLTEDLKYFILGDETDELNFGFNTKTIIFDFSDLDNPQFEFDYFGTTPAIDHNGYTKNNKYYLANYTAGLTVLDISDLGNQNMSEIGYFDTYPSSNSAGFSGAWNVYPYFESGNIVISNVSGGGFFLVKSNAVDSTSPLAVCQNITVELDDNGTVTVIAETIDGGSSDNVGITSFELNISTFTCNDIGDNDVILSVFDAVGNSDSCDAVITVEDNILPNIVGQNITVSLEGNPSVTVAAEEVDNESFDNCSIVSLTLTPNTFTTVGTFDATLEGIDDSGNMASVTVEITIIDFIDDEAPIAVCQNLTVILDENGEGTISAESVDGGSSDNSGSYSLSIDINFFDCSNIGENEVTLTVIDPYENTDTCIAIITIEDNMEPEIGCPENQTLQAGADGTIILPDYVLNNEVSATDNCSENLIIIQNPNAGEAIGVGSNTITFETTDDQGNVSSCSFEIEVLPFLNNDDHYFINGLSIYPNPSSNLVTVNSKTDLLTSILIFDINGKQILDINTINSETKTLDISNFSNGIYFMTINNVVTKKLIKI
jgi:choice-of-anchor B domain-containing protein